MFAKFEKFTARLSQLSTFVMFALFALLVVAFAAPNPKPQFLTYSTAVDYASYPQAGVVPFSAYSAYSPYAYSAYSGVPSAVYLR